jgi:hypothetical protein
MPTDLFEVEAYDGVDTTTDNRFGNIISEGKVSNLRMDTEQLFQDLVVLPLDETNGVYTNYQIEFAAAVPTLDGDQLYIKFPDTIRTPMQPICRPPDFTSCVEEVSCSTETGKIVATFTKVCESDAPLIDKKYIFYIENVKNAGTMIKSEKFDAYTMSSQFQQIVKLDSAASVTVTTKIAGSISTGNFTIRQD